MYAILMQLGINPYYFQMFICPLCQVVQTDLVPDGTHESDHLWLAEQGSRTSKAVIKTSTATRSLFMHIHELYECVQKYEYSYRLLIGKYVSADAYSLYCTYKE